MVSLLLVVIVTAIVFDYINGFHDAANAIATVVSTGVLPIRTAVFMAGVFNFLGAVTGTAVAKTIASGFADPAIVSQTVVLAALLGAIAWNLITWWKGIPSSSSHALIGALGGAVVAHAGVSAFKWSALVESNRAIRKLEKEGDMVYREAVSALFHDDAVDAKRLLREKQVLEDLESAIDHCEKVGDTLANLAVKHG